MKGLLIKDWYMALRYCRMYALVCIVFLVVAVIGEESVSFAFFPCLLCSMIPVTLLSYDKRSGWTEFSRAMPYTAGQIVSAKYLTGLIPTMIVTVIVAIEQAVFLNIKGEFELCGYMVLMMVGFILSLLPCALIMPFVFRLGVENGRIAYYAMNILVCGGMIALPNAIEAVGKISENITGLCGIAVLLTIGLYALSWRISISMYQKRTA